MNQPKYYPLLLLLCSAALFLTNLDVLQVTIMEARNFITAREMITDGNWVLTTMNDLPRYQKPPLPTWISALSALVFGAKSIAVYRVPVGLMGVFTIWIFFKLIQYISKNNKLALISGLILATSFYVFAIQREAPWDIFAHGFMIASILYLFKMLREDVKVYQNMGIAALFFGLSFLSKGPISPYGLLLPFLIAFGIAYRYKNIKSKILPILLYFIIGLLLGGWWFLYVRYADPQAFIEITQKETANWSSYNVRPFWYYWSFFTQSGIWTIPAFVALLFPYLKNRIAAANLYKFSFFWTIAVVVLLSIIPEKKSRYLLPVLIPMALNTALYFEYLFNQFKNITNKGEKFPVYFHFGLVALIGIAFPIAGYFVLQDKPMQGLWWQFGFVASVLFVLGIFIVIQLYKKNIQKTFLLSIFFMIAALGLGMPLSKAMQTNTSYNNIEGLNTEISNKSLPVYHLGEISPEMLWYYGEAIEPYNNKQANEYYVLVNKNQENTLKTELKTAQKVDLVTTFDLNYSVNPDEKKHKNRLVSKLYYIKE